ncbi:hypothetical protein MZK49_15945 [Ensifer sesbaniae]|uniref:hypothetical protein n=1 Tax=Ensifer sesbaniae TaxID=1214071 RepID=UPI002000ACAF|nr:hypothetical protein [Ensifer sesbaniae]
MNAGWPQPAGEVNNLGVENMAEGNDPTVGTEFFLTRLAQGAPSAMPAILQPQASSGAPALMFPLFAWPISPNDFLPAFALTGDREQMPHSVMDGFAFMAPLFDGFRRAVPPGTIGALGTFFTEIGLVLVGGYPS